MKVVVKVENVKEARAKLEKYAELTGNGIETGVKEIGIATAHALAHKVQPFGFKKLAKFETSVQSQVKRAVRNANLSGQNGSIESAHAARRNSRGQVSKNLNTKGKYQGKPYDPQQRAALQKRKADKVGLLKGAWVEAGNKLVTVVSKARRALKRINVTDLVMRHASQGNGKAFTWRKGLNFTIYLTNKVSYVRQSMKNSHVESAIKKGQEKGYKKIDAHIKRETKRLAKI